MKSKRNPKPDAVANKWYIILYENLYYIAKFLSTNAQKSNLIYRNLEPEYIFKSQLCFDISDEGLYACDKLLILSQYDIKFVEGPYNTLNEAQNSKFVRAVFRINSLKNKFKLHELIIKHR